MDCGEQHGFTGSRRCHRCYDRRRRGGAVRRCSRCAKQRPIHDIDGRCDACVYACRGPLVRVLPPCVACGEHRSLSCHGHCNRCWLKTTDSALIYASNLVDRLSDDAPAWLGGFVDHVVTRYSPSEARLRMRDLARLLPGEPAALVAAATRPDGRLSPLARTLEQFFAAAGALNASGDGEARAASRRQRILGRVPETLGPTVTAFSAAELVNRERARRVGARVLTDQTLAVHLEVVADFANRSGLTDWATAASGDIESFIADGSPAGSHVLPSLRAFFGWARSQRLILVDPTRTLRNTTRQKYSGPVVDLDTQRRLFRRWRSTDAHPNEALVGLLALLHAASVRELCGLQASGVDIAARTVALGARPSPVPLDPVTWTATEAVLAHRASLDTPNPHLLVNRRTRVCEQPVAPTHPNDLLAPLGVTPQQLRCSRLAQLVTTTDPVMVAETFALTHGAALYYLGDSVNDIMFAERVDHQASPATR